jgi:branched-chain amino acid transport system permease protein
MNSRFTPRVGWSVFCALLTGLLVIAPAVVGRGTQSLLLTLLLYAALAQAWNLVGGFAGQLSLGHTAFLGAGGYTTAMLLLEAQAPLAVALPASGLAGAVFALVTSVALLRLRGVYFVIATLAVALAAHSWMMNWEYAGASKGLNLPIADLPSPLAIYYLALALVVAVTLTAWWFTWSAFGLRVMAVRDDEDAARSLGVDGTRIKTIVFTLSGFFTGLIGAVVALNQIALAPDNLFGLSWTIGMVVMTIIGGLGSVAGPLAGATVVYYLIEKQFESQPDIAALVAGILVIAIIRYAPAGVWGLAMRPVARIDRRMRRTAND